MRAQDPERAERRDRRRRVAAARRLDHRARGGDRAVADRRERLQRRRIADVDRDPRDVLVPGASAPRSPRRRRRRGSRRASASMPAAAAVDALEHDHARAPGPTMSPSTAPASIEVSCPGSPTRTSRASGRTASTSRAISDSETIEVSSTITTSCGSRLPRSCRKRLWLPGRQPSSRCSVERVEREQLRRGRGRDGRAFAPPRARPPASRAAALPVGAASATSGGVPAARPARRAARRSARPSSSCPCPGRRRRPRSAAAPRASAAARCCAGRSLRRRVEQAVEAVGQPRLVDGGAPPSARRSAATWRSSRQ